MKKVLITGAGSYVGTAVEKHLQKYPDQYSVSTLNMIGGKWKSADFSEYDTVFHVAGLAHADVGKVTDTVKAKYYAVNTDLAIATAKKAKAEGVRQFIFMSSAIVYGDSAPISEKKVIYKSTPYQPANFYGDSKAQAEKGLLALQGDGFDVVILRCPMIYGKNSKGNFPELEKIALKTPVFPRIYNRRSMLYIGNLTEFVRLMIENNERGVFWPCNKEVSNTAEIVQMIAACHGKKVRLVPWVRRVLKGVAHFNGYVNKAFGNLEYAEGLGDYKQEYRLYTLEESIKETEADD